MFLNWDFLGLSVCCSRHLIEMICEEKSRFTIYLCFGSKMSYIAWTTGSPCSSSSVAAARHEKSAL